MRRKSLPQPLAMPMAAVVLGLGAAAAEAATCERELTADVVAIDQVFRYNRMGAFNPDGMIYALRRDTIDDGSVRLRDDKRPRPLVLRMNVGDCLTISFQNLLSAAPGGDQPATRTASIHVAGLQLVDGIGSDGSYVGANASSLVGPGQSTTYKVYADREGTFLMYSTAAPVGGEGDAAALAAGLFGAVNVEPRGAKWYRSQVTREELQQASVPVVGGRPTIDYEAVFASGPNAGLPILNMLDGLEIIYSDTSAIITGSQPDGEWPLGTFGTGWKPAHEPNRYYPQTPGGKQRTREEAFREQTIIFHDEIIARQAFAGIFADAAMGHTLHGVRDGFAINYGTAGLGAELLGNRLGVGPMAECNECRYEEFFLTAWVVGDPAMVVDVPADQGLEALTPADDVAALRAASPQLFGRKATVAKFPSDPSNVFHSYLNDRVRLRNLHAGPKEHHIFHLHAHQWTYSAVGETSNYLDSQAIGPGSGYTYEITYNGSGNRNLTAGDAIFHCHFYPHFAQGMWGLWRVHDVFEEGTELDGSGRPVAGARALPDAEILEGTPIPAVVPLPNMPMPPLPGPVQIVDGQAVVDPDADNPGFPFFIPGRAGHRPPRPPLDAVEDGGLPRHVAHGGVSTGPALNPFDFGREHETLEVEFLPEDGTAIEKKAMAFHGVRSRPSVTSAGVAAPFVTNGLPPIAGAPYADPCISDDGDPVGSERVYKVAHFQLEMKLNKLGHFFPQARMAALWGDVAALQNGTKAPEPMFLRANTNDCIVYHLTNLLPRYYEMDAFQVRTPTDVTGQHIHLVKFDVTASDGASNGWNYEDGAMAPGEVIERIEAIREANDCPPGESENCPVAKPHSFFGVLGAQTIVQRWYADDVLDAQGNDRTLKTIFTHDHFAPSTHQQVGLYAALIAEPTGSTWRHPETGATMGSRFDGGPTSWHADILTEDQSRSYREFLLQLSDFVLAYEGGAVSHQTAINPPVRNEIGLPMLVRRGEQCPGGHAPPCPEAISVADPGTMAVNYRNEPLAYRVMQPADVNTPLCRADGSANCVQAPGKAGDLAFALRSDVTRAIPALNSQPGFYPPLTGGVKPGDPFTPLLRVYKGDPMQVRIIYGGQEEGHIASINGLKWLREPDDPASGWRNGQMAGISEQFTLSMPLIPAEGTLDPYTDHLWMADTSSDGLWSGAWGLLRSYDTRQSDLLPLPSNTVPASGSMQTKITNLAEFSGACPIAAPKRLYTVYAVRAGSVFPEGTLTYNPRPGAGSSNGPLHDPDALVYVRDSDLDIVLVGRTYQYRLKADAPREPLVLRARAGECIEVTLRNVLPAAITDEPAYNLLPMVAEGFNSNQVRPSPNVGLNPQLVAVDVGRYDGMNVGLNRVASQTPASNRAYKYRWYAGDLAFDPATGKLVATPVEFGAANLSPADPVKHSAKGLVGALVIEPADADWSEDPGTRAQATVTRPDGSSFREFVLVMQDDIQLRDQAGTPICPIRGETPEGPVVASCVGIDDPEDTGNKAVNYRSEPIWFRKGFASGASLEEKNAVDYTDVLSNALVGGDPATPVLTARKGQQIRFRVLQPGGKPRNKSFHLHGHGWEVEPYVPGVVASQGIGANPRSLVTGVQAGMGPRNHFDIVPLNGAGGAFLVTGDYLYRDLASFAFDGGLWGIMRVTD